MFRKPDRRTYGGKPFWAWNGKLEKNELLRQIDIMKEMGFGGFFMHSRTGLETEYLGDEWFELINACADKAESEDMESWLYDEDRWPSGSAGGLATKEEKYRMQYIRMNIVIRSLFEWSNDIISAFAADVDGIDFCNCIPLTSHSNIEDIEQNSVIYFTQEYMTPQDVYNGCTYLDTLKKEATEHFLDITHDKYKERCGDRFGKSILGIFTDEPHRGALMSSFCVPNRDAQNLCPYTDDLFEEFEKSFGYKLQSCLPDLFLRRDGKLFSQVKWHFTELLTQMFIDNFAKPYYDRCNKYGLRVTGHILHENNLTSQVSTMGSVMRYYEYMDYPGVDYLTADTHDICVTKQLSSVCRQIGKKWMLSELNGCTGWQMTFKDYKAIGDFQAITGINVRCPHLSWYTMNGEAKRDYPASILHQSSWYKVNYALEDYYSRINEITTNSERICDTAVMMPVESVWAQIYAGWAIGMGAVSEEVHKVESDFSHTYEVLCANQIDFDYADEDMFAKHFKVDGDTLYIGNAAYKTFIVSGARTIRSSTLDILEQFRNNGGKVIFAGDAPELVDAIDNSRALEFAKNCDNCSIDELKNIQRKVSVSSNDILLQTYKDETHTYYFALNRNANCDLKNVVINFGEPVQLQLWDAVDGEKWAISDGKDSVTADFAKGQLHIFVDSTESLESVGNKINYRVLENVYAKDDFDLQLCEPNVLVIDKAAYQIDDGDIAQPEYVISADDKIRDIFGFSHRGGEMLQPWVLGKRDLAVAGKVSLFYSFEVEEGTEFKACIMYEKPIDSELSVNGIEVTEKPSDTVYIDRCFNIVDISNYISEGVNTVCITFDYKENSNIEAVYVLGNFVVKMPDMVLSGQGKKPVFGSLVYQGYPFFGGKLTYTLKFDKKLHNQDVATLVLKDYENAACYEVNGKPIPFPPYEIDVTDSIRKCGECDVTVYLTRRNMFGPFHQQDKYQPAIGPLNFHENVRDDYSLYDSGILEKPFIQIKRPED